MYIPRWGNSDSLEDTCIYSVEVIYSFGLRPHKNIRATEMFKATRSKMASISMLLKMLSISNAPQYCK